MEGLNNIQDRLITQIMATKNTQFLSALEGLFGSINNEDKKVSLSSSQVEMLKMSEQDIKNGDLISEEELDKLDDEWLS